MSEYKIQTTKNYRLFARSADNRPLDPAKHKKLRRSMEQHGFYYWYPIVCVRDADKHLVVFDGQHRLAFAETLGLPVHYVVAPLGFNIAQANCTQTPWQARNFAETYAAQGKVVYQQGLDFADRHGISVGMAFGLLAGTSSWSNVSTEYYMGEFRIRDEEWAEMVGTVYSQLLVIAPRVRNARLLEACMAVARVTGFDPQRLLSGAERCREKLVSYATRDAFLEMLEELYNFGRKNLVALKIGATQAMKDRSAANNKKAVLDE